MSGSVDRSAGLDSAEWAGRGSFARADWSGRAGFDVFAEEGGSRKGQRRAKLNKKLGADR